MHNTRCARGELLLLILDLAKFKKDNRRRSSAARDIVAQEGQQSEAERTLFEFAMSDLEGG